MHRCGVNGRAYTLDVERNPRNVGSYFGHWEDCRHLQDHRPLGCHLQYKRSEEKSVYNQEGWFPEWIGPLLADMAVSETARSGPQSEPSGGGLHSQAMGVAVELGPEGVARCVREAGVGFMFAPRFHPAMAAVVPVRRSLKVPHLRPAAIPPICAHPCLGGSALLWIKSERDCPCIPRVPSVIMKKWWRCAWRLARGASNDI